MQANRVLAIVRKMFNWAVQRGALESNPAAATVKPGIETPRTRNLTPKEIRALWDGLPNTDMHPLIQLALKLSLVTAARKGETLKAKKADFDLIDKDGPAWLIPASNSKNKRPNRLPLSPFAVTLCGEIMERAGESEYMFPSPTRKDRPITERAVSQALRRNLGTLSLTDIRPHDMRRVASTGMASVGVLREIREHVLNHSQGKLDQAYDLHDYWPEKKAALERWADKLVRILNEDRKVVELDTMTA